MATNYVPLNEAVKRYTGLGVEREYPFHPSRRWRFDYAIPSVKIAIEVEGGVHVDGRHISPEGYLRDMDKYNEAAALGWLVIRTLPNELMSLKTLRLIVMAINSRHINNITDLNKKL